MNPLVYRIVGTNENDKVGVLRLRFGRLAYYQDELTAQRALAQLLRRYPDARIQYSSGDWRTVEDSN